MNRNPFIPQKNGNTIIIDGRVSQDQLRNFKNLDLNIIPTIKCKELPGPIAYHPDIVLHPINHNTIIVAPNVFDYYKVKLSNLGIRVLEGGTVLGKDYYDHIGYNVARIGKYAIHNLKYTDEKLKHYLKKENLKFIHVNQGYTKCSVAIINERAIITSDIPIHDKLKDLGIDVLLIEPGYIELSGHPYGFVGGTSGNLSAGKIVFSGKFLNHPDKDRIIKFLKKYNQKIIWLSDKNIVDIGTILSLDSK